jgi:ribose-phosphate pyrophosphokinase
MGAPILQHYYRKHFAEDIKDTIVVSPDVGGIRRARAFAKALGTDLAIIDKRRPRAAETEVMNVIGDIKGKRVILADDMVSTGGTLCNNAETLVEMGATEVYACCSHAILAGNAAQRVQDSVIKELLVLDTVFLPMEKRIPKIVMLSSSMIFSEAIYRLHTDEPLSVLYNRYLE